MVWIAKRWRCPKLVYSFFAIEFALTIPALVLFALADPDAYRTKLWHDGYKNGFNSNPQQRIYSYANYHNPDTPLVWSQFLTTFNVVISVLSMFALLIKAVMFILHIWLPIISFLVHGGLAAIWAYSVYGQTGSDMTDPKQPQPGAPWYITKSCSVAFYPNNQGNCMQAKGCLAITVLMLAVFAANALFAAVCIIPTKQEREDRQRERDEEADSDLDDEDEAAQQGQQSDENSIEMEQIAATKRNMTVSTTAMKSPTFPPPPGTAVSSNPMTPRSTAFHRLGGMKGDLPLRQ